MTVTSTVPVPAGAVAVMVVELSTVKVAGLPVPKSTAVAPVKLVPVIVTEVPPVVGPELGAHTGDGGRAAPRCRCSGRRRRWRSCPQGW